MRTEFIHVSDYRWRVVFLASPEEAALLTPAMRARLASNVSEQVERIRRDLLAGLASVSTGRPVSTGNPYRVVTIESP